MHKFFIGKEEIQEAKAIIQGEDVKHIYKVLRLQAGDKIAINDGAGKEYIGQIEHIDKKEVIVTLLEEIPINHESPIEVYLYQGLPKSAKMDLIVQKNTELGVREITPILTERVVVKTEEKEFKKVDRWNRIALEACKQSKRSLIPTIRTPITFDTLLEELKNMDLIIVPYENKEGYGMKQAMKKLKEEEIKKVAVIVGPEGGFAEEEISLLEQIKSEIITLGPRILRTETAGFVAVSLIMYELGDVGGIEQ